MKSFGLSVRTGTALCTATALLAGCGSGAPSVIHAPSADVHSLITARSSPDGSWMSPEAKAAKRLLYVSDQNSNHVYVYNYKTGRLMGRLNGFYRPSGQCVDASGDVWITDYLAEAVVEFPHGASRHSKRLRTKGLPNSCSIDPTTGALAVSDAAMPHGGSAIEIFDTKGHSHVYSSKKCDSIVQAGYDGQGNLFVAASSLEFTASACELPNGGSSLQVVPLNKTIDIPGGVMWDGQYITFTETYYQPLTTALYQAQPDGSGGLQIVGTTVLLGSCRGGPSAVLQPFILGNANTPANHEQGYAVVGSNHFCDQGSGGYSSEYWNYPAGGTATQDIFDAPLDPTSESVSIAP